MTYLRKQYLPNISQVSGKTIAYVLTDLISKAKLQETEQRRDALIRLIGSKKKTRLISQRKQREKRTLEH